MNHRIVFTGGPGAGKTAVITYLKHLGYQTATEVGRQVIQKQVEQQGTALPWMDKVAFRDEMVLAEMNQYAADSHAETTFFDRSVIDSYGYSQLEGIPVSAQLLTSCHELIYDQNVFIFPPWESIYNKDAERKQDFHTAVATYREMVKAYQKFGYELIEVPKCSVQERAAFILERISRA
ncbi:AAA family ATPase [Photobacterium sp. GJ3]|uniref:AAA family ATPase n=1 Tax=Photobacterium sp. GJ3 TaxID=2829502 RepID=UPI001B8D42F9|nr:AAA family ATPase [Photobacterium sp. GJ3]QUJ66227.1 AAA family ATPase [Photobacterium sp. GJ3]